MIAIRGSVDEEAQVKLVLLNDDVTPISHVIKTLIALGCDKDFAVELTEFCEIIGEVDCGEFEESVAKSIINKLHIINAMSGENLQMRIDT